jgi:hypothetical protein
MKNAPEMRALWMMALGMLWSGFLTSAPSVVALSNPTKLNIASTSPSRTPEKLTPRSENWARSTWKPCCQSRSANTELMTRTETSSI